MSGQNGRRNRFWALRQHVVQYNRIVNLNHLLSWYQKNKRDFPWRKTSDPYQIWVSEIMLQQTQAARVVDFYNAFLEKFPHVESLSKATWEDVLNIVRGMGYYRRFQNMQKTAELIVRKHGGKFPDTYELLRTLPGIGEYTANAILAFAFEQDVAVIDTNVRRLLSPLAKTHDPKKLSVYARKICPKGRAKDFFQALMDYASAFPARVTPKKRNTAASTGAQRKLPALRVAAGIIHRGRKILIQQRTKAGPLKGFWEFPGGKLEVGEDARACLKREVKEELDIEVSVRPAFHKVRHVYPGRVIEISFHRCQILLGTPKAMEKQRFTWITPQEFKNYRMVPADGPVISMLQRSFR